MMRIAKNLVPIVFLTLSAVAAAGEPIAQTDQHLKDKAIELFHEGKDRFRKKDYAGAHASFMAAWRLTNTQSWTIAANLGDCELELGKYRAAAEHFWIAKKAILPTASAREKSMLEARYKEAMGRVATINVTADEGAEVFVDDRSVGVAPLAAPVFLEPGSAEISARMKDRASKVEKVDAVAGESKTLVLKLETAPVASASASATATTPPPPALVTAEPVGEKSKLPLYVGIGATTVGAAVAIGFFIAASGKASDRDAARDGIPATNPCGAGSPATYAGACDSIHQLGVDAVRDRNIAYVGLGVAGLGLGAIAYYLLSPQPQSTGRAVVSPTVGRQSASLSFSGSF